MSSKIAEIVSEKVRVLPPEQQREVLDFVEQLTKGRVSAKSTRGIWEEVEEIIARVPDEAWHDVPSDGSEQHDHYLSSIFLKSPHRSAKNPPFKC